MKCFKFAKGDRWRNFQQRDKIEWKKKKKKKERKVIK